jgi:hypothetical protein
LSRRDFSAAYFFACDKKIKAVENEFNGFRDTAYKG